MRKFVRLSLVMALALAASVIPELQSTATAAGLCSPPTPYECYCGGGFRGCTTDPINCLGACLFPST